MKNTISNQLRRLSVILALFGMTLGILFPLNSVQRVAASEKTVAPVEIQKPDAAQVEKKLGGIPVYFEENRGQQDKRVKYMTRGGGTQMFLTATEAVYVLRGQEPKGGHGDTEMERLGDLTSPHLPLSASPRLPISSSPRPATAVYMRLAGANDEANFAATQPLEHKTNYFKGAESDWRTDISNYQTITAENIYEGVDIVWQGKEQGNVQYDFVVKPNANPNAIAWEIEGASNVSIDADGSLVIETELGVMKQSKPFTYQETEGVKSEVSSHWSIDGNQQLTNDKGQRTFRVQYDVSDYDSSKALTIDPTVNLSNLAFSTFLGGGGDDQGNAIAVDNLGNTYVTGYTNSQLFPTTAGTVDTAHNGGQDVFVSKLNAAGSSLVYSTFIGGDSDDVGNGIEVDSVGNVFVTGYTFDTTTDYPTTLGAFDTTHNGNYDVFVSRLNAAGSSLVYSTFLGGDSTDVGYGIAVDSAGNAFVTGSTFDTTTDYPTTVGAFDTTHNGNYDVFVSRLNGAGSSLVYSTFLGGDSNDFANGIAVDSAGNAFVTGNTLDAITDYPTTVGAFDTIHNGNADVFVTKLNAAGSSLVYSTFLGGDSTDVGTGIEVDSLGNAFVTGHTRDTITDYPTTVGAFDTTHNGTSDVFVSKLNAAGSSLVYSTFIGGDFDDLGFGIAVDSAGNAFVTGYTFDATTDYPTTILAFDTTHNGNADVFVSKLNAAGSSLVYSTFIGGDSNDLGYGIAVDSAGNAFVTGNTFDGATDYPTTNEAFQSFHEGNGDAFVTKLGDYSITGKVIDPTGLPLANVMIAMSGPSSSNMITGPDGQFRFLNTSQFYNHTITATRSGYSINPALFNIIGLNINRELIFVGTPGSPTGGGGGQLRFENLVYNKSENGSTVTATVRRTGQLTTTEPVTVDYETSNQTAIAGQDYVGTSGVLTFTVGDNSKTITIPITNDSTLEPREDFKITLSNPTNDAEIEPNRAIAIINILDEDLKNGNLLISEFRQRGRLGANDEYIKIFNPNDFDITINAADDSTGMTLAKDVNGVLTAVATIPNLVTIASRGHYLLTNNNPLGGFSLIDYPTGNGSTTSTGDQTFSANINDNANLVLLKTANNAAFNAGNVVDAVGFNGSWTSEGRSLPTISPENGENCYVRKLTPNGLQDTGSNLQDFMLISNHAQSFGNNEGGKIYSILGSPAPETSDSLSQMKASEVSFTEIGTENWDNTPIPNGAFGMLTMYRRITNNTSEPITRLRLRAIEFPTAGSASQKRYSSRPDFRLLSSTDDGTFKGVTLAADRLQPNGGGINSTLSIDSITANNPLNAGESVTVAIKFGVMRYGRHPFQVAIEGMK
jgi:Calx-beta domain/Beta-propeller repeat